MGYRERDAPSRFLCMNKCRGRRFRKQLGYAKG